MLEPRSPNSPTFLPSNPRRAPAFPSRSTLEGGVREQLPYLYQVHAHEPQEVLVACQLPEVLAQGDAACFLTTHQRLFLTYTVGRGEEMAGLAQSGPGDRVLKSDSDPREPRLVTHPLSTTMAEYPLSLLVVSIRRLNNCVAPRKPRPEPAASTTQKARKEEKSSLFQKA